MLTRCPRCGKPVYAPGGRVRVECGYCYHFFDPTPLHPLKPESVDWKKPIYEAVEEIPQPSEMCRWLALLGSYADAPQRIEQIRHAEQNKLKISREALNVAAESARIEQIMRDLERIDRHLCDPEEIDRVLKAAQEKHALLKQQETERKLFSLRFSVETAPSVKMIDLLIADLLMLPPMEKREALLAAAYEKRGLLMQKEEAEKARKEKREKRKRRLLRSLPFIGAALTVCYILLSIHVFQPSKLEKAAELTQAGAYAEAEEVYLSLLSPSFFRNQSAAAQAQEALSRLRNQWAEALAEQGDLKGALVKYRAAENKEAARKTAIAYAEALAEQGQTDDAIMVLERAGSDPEILDLLQTMYVQQADQTGKQVIAQWIREEKQIGDAAYQALSETGFRFQNVDAQLHYWGLLADAGIDLTRVYPDGVQVSGFSLPKEYTVFSSYNASKPLFIQRREDEYILSPASITNSLPIFFHHDPNRSDHYTVTLLPECWQRLPKERRAASLREVTSIFAVNLTFPPAGSCYGQYRARNHLYYPRSRQALPPATVTEYTYFPLYHAKMELLLWKYPGSDIMLLWSKTAVPMLDGTASTPLVIIDWTEYPLMSVSTIKAGLSGAFDERLIHAVLQQIYEQLLNLGEE